MAQQTIHRLRIELRGIQPKIWRRIDVPSAYTFWDLHSAIQDAMGWFDSHLHEFRVRRQGRETTISPEDEDFPGGLIEWETPIASYFATKGDKAIYSYDFGDDWTHDVTLVAIKPAAAGATYPVCLDGRRACPPEDCGGTWGYADLLAALADPNHEEHESKRSWLGGDFDPESFDKADVVFHDPQARLKAWQDYGRL